MSKEIKWGPWTTDRAPWGLVPRQVEFNDAGLYRRHRVEHVPVVVEVVKYAAEPNAWRGSLPTHKVTYNTIDGVIDCSSVKMEEM